MSTVKRDQISLYPRYLYDQISQRDYMESLQNFKSPLEHTLMLGDLGTPHTHSFSVVVYCIVWLDLYIQQGYIQ